MKNDRERVRQRLTDILRQPAIVDALFVASPSLEHDLHRWKENPESKKGRRIENSVMKYYMRAGSRSTPFGLFSGVSTGTFGDKTRLEMAPRSEYVRHTRLDMDYLTALSDHLARDPQVRRESMLRMNSSVYTIGDRVRYAEARLSGRSRDYFLVDAEVDEFLAATLDRASDGARMKELAEALVDDDITLEDAEAYIQELIDARLILPDIGPAITGPEALGDLINQFRAMESTAPVAEALDRVRRELSDIDEGGVGVPPSQYRNVANELKALDVEADIARLFQVDMTKPTARVTLDNDVRDKIAAAVEALVGLFGHSRSDPFKDFRNDFRERYGDREVPLVEVLDEEVGIGFQKSNAPTSDASPLLRGLAFPLPSGENRVAWTPWNTFLQRRLLETLADGRDELVLTDDEVRSYSSSGTDLLPDAFQVSCRLVQPAAFAPELDNESGAGASDDAVAVGNRVIVESFHGPSGARLLGRFCHADPDLHAHVRAHLRAEEALDTGAVYCEVVHHPQGRIGNILARPLLRDYELVYLGRSGAPIERQIDINDLMLSIRGDKIVVRSKRLGKEVIPRLTTAHNTMYGSLGTYKFLAALQSQLLVQGGSWNWGTLADLPFLPRVRHGEAYLTLATWNFARADVERITRGDPDTNFGEIQRWRTEQSLPRFVGLADGDNILTIDFDNPLSVDALVALVKNRRGFKMRERPGPDELVVQGPEGHFQHELVVPFVKKSGARGASSDEEKTPAVGLRDTSAPSLFPPGSEWLYVKIYGGPATLDRVLLDVVHPSVTRAIETGDVGKWFFIRYSDPRPHLRVRYSGDPEALMARVLPDIHRALTPLLDDRLLWKIQLDTYDREVVRYGGHDATDLCEDIFHADSEAIVRILGHYEGDEAGDARWRLTFKGMDMLLDDLGFNLEGKYRVLTRASDSFSREFGIAGAFRKDVLNKYRSERKSLTDLVRGGTGDGHPLSAGVAELAHRSPAVVAAASGLRDLAGRGELTRSLPEITASILHMHANRFLRWSHRAQESLIYNFLVREYDSQLARNGVKKTDRNG